MLYVDLVSQPSRACALFVAVAGLAERVDVAVVNIAKAGNKTKEYLDSVNPLGKVPGLAVPTLGAVPESCAILAWLVAANRDVVAEHWFPREGSAGRARADGALAWHHGTLRRGAAGLCWELVVAKNLKRPTSPALLASYRQTLKQALADLSAYWLADGKLPYVGGAQPCVADLVFACELAQLAIVEHAEGAEHADTLDGVLAAHPAVSRWFANVRTYCGPAWDDAHKIVNIMASKRKQAAAKAKL